MTVQLQNKHHRITGNVRVEDRAKGRVWVAAYVKADGAKTRKTLGPAWAKDSGRRTPRGAILWRAADGPKPDHTYLTPRDAEEALTALLVAERGKPQTARRVRGKTFGQAAAEWLDHVETVKGVEATTLRNYQVIVGKLCDEFPADLPLAKIAEQRISAYQHRLLGQLARKTVRNRMQVLGGILARATKLGWIAVDPMTKVDVVSQPPPDPDFNVLEPSQVEAVAEAVAALPDDALPLMRNGEVDECSLAAMRERRALYAEVIRFAAYTGLRAGEIRALRWRDIDWTGEFIRVPRNAPTSAPANGRRIKAPKGKRGRSVPLIAPAAAVLDRLKARGYRTDREALVLPTRTGGMLDVGRVRDAFYLGLDAVGLGYLRDKDNPIVFHDLRHTFATIAVRVLPLTDVQAYMGHADIQTTMRYVHHVPRSDTAKRLTAAFTGEVVPQHRPAVVTV